MQNEPTYGLTQLPAYTKAKPASRPLSGIINIPHHSRFSEIYFIMDNHLHAPISITVYIYMRKNMHGRITCLKFAWMRNWIGDFFLKTQDIQRCLQIRTPMNGWTHTSYPYEQLRETESHKIDPAGFEIDEVNTYTSLSMENVTLHRK
jgi:hypothetical protein